jgi:hypothetical protein
MCILGAGALLGLGGAGAATAAGATAAATTTAGALQTLATIATIGGTLYSGISAYQSGRAQAAAIDNQAATERALNATQDQRERVKFASAIAQQRAEIAGRGIDLSSPTAIYLGETAAQEMSFNSQAVRSTGDARQTELSTQARITRSNASAGLISGVVGAASNFLTSAPDVWPGLLRDRQLA